MRDSRIPVMLSASQKDLIKGYAKNAGLSMSTYLLKRGLNNHIKPVLSGVETQLYRHLINANTACENEEYDIVKNEIISAINLFIKNEN